MYLDWPRGYSSLEFLGSAAGRVSHKRACLLQNGGRQAQVNPWEAGYHPILPGRKLSHRQRPGTSSKRAVSLSDLRLFCSTHLVQSSITYTVCPTQYRRHLGLINMGLNVPNVANSLLFKTPTPSTGAEVP